MPLLQYKIDFAVIFSVKGANPNGDPLNGNRPRTDYDGYGEMADVCIKRKVRDRLQEQGHSIFVQSDNRRMDEYRSLRARAEAAIGQAIKSKDEARVIKEACDKWLDVRAFGQLFAFKEKGGKKGKGNAAKPTEAAVEAEEVATGEAGVSIGIRGPVTIQTAISIEPINVDSMQITKSVSGEGDGSKRGSDTMGMKHRVKKTAIYCFYGAMNPQLAEKTNFSDEDAEVIRNVLPKLFENDASSARPEGTMQVLTVFWWRHNCKAGQYSSAKVHGSLRVNPDGTYRLDELQGLGPDVISGF